MKISLKLLQTSALVLIVALVSSCATKRSVTGDSFRRSNAAKYIITSEKYGFMLEAPKTWEDRVEIREDAGFVVAHKTVSQSSTAQNPIIFTIVEYGDREKWEQDSSKENQPFPYKKLGEINGKVYAYILSFDLPYDEKTPEDLKQYTAIMNEVETVLKTFKAIKSPPRP